MSEFLEYLEYLYKGHSNVHRKITQPFVYENVRNDYPDRDYQPGDNIVCETLIEHVGSLPLMTIAFYPHLNDSEVDLGETMTLLAIHDIGEIETGDETIYKKKADADRVEYEAALKILDPIYHEKLHDVEHKISKSAKFAKAIDKLTPDILDYFSTKEVMLYWYSQHMNTEDPQDIVDIIRKHKQPFFAWNEFLTEFHEYLLEEISKKLSK